MWRIELAERSVAALELTRHKRARAAERVCGLAGRLHCNSLIEPRATRTAMLAVVSRNAQEENC